jgi:hypothetical protein
MKTPRLLALIVATGMTACQGPTTPEPPDPPRGKADSTILENIEVVRAREAATGRDSILVALGGVGAITGTSCPDGGWWYRFAARPSYRLYDWTVYCDGDIEFLGEKTDAAHHDMTEIGPVLNLDSDDLAQVMPANGGQDYLDRYPQARFGLSGRYIGRRPIWEVFFTTLDVPCGFSAVIDGQTGAVHRTSPPCP